MNIIIASSGNLLSNKIDEHFGRAAWLLKYKKEVRQTEFIKNPFRDMAGGIGEKMAIWLQENDIEMVVAAEFGAKMRDKLETMRIKMVVINDSSSTLQEIIKKINQ
jgi:predicted Fe-Mo cluster-binding NifX family protein